MRQYLTLFALFAIATCLSSKVAEEKLAFLQFQDFINKYGKQYQTVQEYMARFNIFKKSLKKIYSNGSFATGITQFSDMTPAEFKRTYLNLDINVLNTIKFEKAEPQRLFGAPTEFNWVDEGAVTPVKNQGSCGSCWAFSTVANLEGLYYLKNKESKTFSEQQLVDCDTQDAGCNGGLMEYAFAWIKSNGGLETDADYPYKGRKQTCSQSSSKFAVSVSGYEKLSSENEEDIKNYLLKTGPLAVALNADPLQYYDSGILDLDTEECDPEGMNHAVALVGYGSENGNDYWIVKNSWGTSWGEQGYFRIARGKGTCGINTYITSAILA